MKRILNSLVICLLIAPVSFSQEIKLSGQVSVENNQIKNVGDPTDPQDAVTLSYLGLAPNINELTILDDFTNDVPTGTSYEELKYYNKYSDLESTDGSTFEINRLTTQYSGGILFYGTLELNSQKNANVFRLSDSSGNTFNLNSFDLKDLEGYGTYNMENFSGSADPGQTVEIYINGTLFSSVVADSNGEWIVEFDGLPNGRSDISINGGYIYGPSLILSSSDGKEVSFRRELDRIYVDENYVDFSFGYTQGLGVQELSWENVEWVDFTSRYTKAKITHLNLDQNLTKEPFSGSYNDLTEKPNLLELGTSAGTALAGDTTTITTAQANAITANSAKTSFPGFGTNSGTALEGDTTTITTAQINAITANTAKVSFPGFGTSAGTALEGDTPLFSGSYNDLTDKPDGDNQLLSLTSSHTLADSDNRKVITFNNSNDVDLSFPGNLSSGFNCIIVQLGTGHVNFVSSGGTILVGGTNLISKQNQARTSGQGAVVNIINVGNENFVLSGDTGLKLPPQEPSEFNYTSITNNKKPIIIFKAETGGTVKIYEDDNSDITDTFTIVEDSGSYILTPKQDLSDGEYNYSVSIVDLFGNRSDSVSVSFTIDTVAPVVSLNGSQYINVEIGGTYNELGASSDGGETISISGDTVNTSSVGTYIITYSATDLAGNTSSLNRTVTIYKSSYSYTGSAQTFTVPPGITSIHVDAYGASGCTISAERGGNGQIGKGGRVEADINVIPGEVLHIYVGGTRHYTGYQQDNGGWNGGGNAGPDGIGVSFPGGGATDIRIGGTDLNNRVIVAGGGGGKQNGSGHGGDGGGLTGQDGTSDTSSGGQRYGSGGSQDQGGVGGKVWNGSNYIVRWNASGSLGQGGTAYLNSGGGGGGYYGGGGGGDGAGGGGSSYTDPDLCSNVIHTRGVQISHGKLIITLNSAE